MPKIELKWLKLPKPTDWVIMTATVVIAGVGILQWCTLNGQLETFNKQLKETTDQFHSSHRPWCAISGDIETIKPVSFESGKITFSCKFLLKNSGTSPAFNVNTLSEVKTGTIEELTQYAQQHPPVDIGFATAATKKFGRFIVPGDTGEGGQEISQSEDISQIINKKIVVMLTLGVYYRDEFDILHYTGERWLYVRDRNDGGYLPTPNIKGHWAPFGLGSVAK